MYTAQDSGAADSLFYENAELRLETIARGVEAHQDITKYSKAVHLERPLYILNYQMLEIARQAYPNFGDDGRDTPHTLATYRGLRVGALVGMRVDRSCLPAVVERYRALANPRLLDVRGSHEDLVLAIDHGAITSNVTPRTTRRLEEVADITDLISPYSRDKFVLAARFALGAWAKAFTGGRDIHDDQEKLRKAGKIRRGWFKALTGETSS